MHTIPSRILLAASLIAATASAQTLGITYVDADCSTNTTLADGTPYTPVASTAVDNEWNLRAFANGGTILSSNDGGGTGEDCPMLRTTISGLIPGLEYEIYAYLWSASNANWRLRSIVDTVVPTSIGNAHGYNAVHFNGSGFGPSTPMAFDATVGFEQVTLDLQYDGLNPLPTATGQLYPEIDGHFESGSLVGIQEGNRHLYEVWLGTHVPDANGEIWVFIDDLANQTSSFNRTWYDGVGYEWAPLPIGAGCGNPAPQIGHIGPPVTTQDFTVTLSAAPASSLALLVIGLDAITWNGLPLPLDLGTFGFPGCHLNVSPLFNLFQQTDPSGAASYTTNLPPIPSLDIYWQWGVLDPTGASLTSGLETKFHR